jgi:hypothetical protein
MTPTEKIAELTASLRAERPPQRRLSEAAKARCRSLGHSTDRPGDRLHRYFNGSPQDGDISFTLGVLGAIKAHKGDVPAIADGLEVGERTFRRWMAKYPQIRAAVEAALPQE